MKPSPLFPIARRRAWLSWTTLLFGSACLAFAAVGGEAPTAKRVEVEEFEKLWQAKTNVVLDVRTKDEYKAGHIPGAINLDVQSPDFATQAGKLDKSKTYLVHCAAGVRSARACTQMTQYGFTSLIDLAPGFKGWEKAGKQVEK